MAAVFFNTAAASPADTTLATINVGTADEIRGLIKSDIAGNLLIQEVIDGTTTERETSVAIVANTVKEFSVLPYAPIVRFVFDNGGALATVRFAARVVSAGPR